MDGIFERIDEKDAHKYKIMGYFGNLWDIGPKKKVSNSFNWGVSKEEKAEIKKKNELRAFMPDI